MHGADGGILFSRRHGSDDTAVLDQDGLAFGGLLDRQVTDAVDCGFGGVHDAPCGFLPGQRHQATMQPIVGLEEFGVADFRTLLHEDLFEILLVGWRAPPGCFAGSGTFERFAHELAATDAAGQYRRHKGAELRPDLHQALFLKLTKRFAHRRAADAHRGSQLFFRQALHRPQHAGDDLLAQMGMDLHGDRVLPGGENRQCRLLAFGQNGFGLLHADDLTDHLSTSI